MVRVLSSLLLAVAAAGCAGEAAPESDDVVVGTAYYSLTSGSILWLNGTYTGCTNRTGAWSTRVSGNGAMTNAALTVTQGDSACQLAITSVMADQTYTASAPLVLGTTYPTNATTFTGVGSSFSANAKLDANTFTSDFQVSFIYIDGSAPTVLSSAVTASFITQAGTVVANTVTAPNYTLDISNLKFAADPVKLIYGVNGTAVLGNATTVGATYVIDSTLSATPSYSDVQTAYGLAFLTTKTLSTNPQTIQASEFGIVSLSLLSQTFVKNIIVKRTQAGVAAYEVFRVTFSS